MPDLKKMLTLEALSEALPSWLKRSTKPEYNADEIDSTLTTNQFVTASDKDNWNAKGTYSKPSGGIPKSDLSSIVQTSLDNADSALQSETDPTVPSWAKQSSKPSYTQDEVADGSTYKRVTQTEKNTWNGKQNALSTTQMQAVNSGITSEKVTQISTNQSNVTLLKNLNGRINYSSVTGFTESRTSSGFSIYYAFSETIPAGEYRIICDAALTDTSKSDQFRLLYSLPATSDSITISPIVSNGHFVSNKITIPKPVVALDLYVNTPTTISNFMIIDEATYQAGFRDYMPHSLPNTTITPALIDQVDSGAKNIIKLTTPYGPGLTNNPNLSVTLDKATGVITISGTTQASGLIYFTEEMSNLKGYVLSGKTDQSENYYHQVYTVSGASGIGNDHGQGAIISDNAVCRDCLYVFTDKTINATLKPMICSLADWNASKKFVPRAKSNYELTQYTDGCSLDIVAKSFGSLNDITQNSYAVYNASVTGKPIDDAGNTSAFTGLCKTDVYNSSEAMQKLTRLSNGHNWVRTKNAGNWNAWIKQGVAPYFINSNSAYITNLLYDAAYACGLSPTDKIHSGMISVTTNTAGESLLVFFTYKHGVCADAQSITNKVISFAGAINNLGTFGVSGGTAPYNFNVMFFS